MDHLHDNAQAAPVPVSLLTGFLGSGKTTVLNHLLLHPELANAAVIINEFGEVGLDHDLVETSTENLILLQSGCLCCTVRGDLVQTLHTLLDRRDKGEIKPFDRIVIETTGLADPAPILHTLMTDRLLSLAFRLDGVIVTVDAATGNQTLDRQFEAVKQAGMADRLVLTKTDLVPSETRKALEQRLRAINPGAHILVAHSGVVDPATLLDAGLFDPKTKSIDAEKWLNAEAYGSFNHHAGAHDHEDGHGDHHRHNDHHGHHDHKSHDHGHDHHHHHDVNRHDDHIGALCLTVSDPIPPEALDLWLEAVMLAKGPDILRLKALLHVVGMPSPLVIHGVQHIFHPPVMLRKPAGADRTSRIVVIGRDLDEAYFRDSLRFLSSAAAAGQLGGEAFEAAFAQARA